MLRFKRIRHERHNDINYQDWICTVIFNIPKSNNEDIAGIKGPNDFSSIK